MSERALPPLDAAWLRRVALSLAIGAAAGALVFVVARGLTAALLFGQQQELLREAAAALRGGVEGLPAGNLRELRRQVEAADAGYLRLSLLAGFVTAAAAAAGSYLWLERRATLLEPVRERHQP